MNIPVKKMGRVVPVEVFRTEMVSGRDDPGLPSVTSSTFCKPLNDSDIIGVLRFLPYGKRVFRKTAVTSEMTGLN